MEVNINKIIDRIDDIPALPQVISKVLNLMKDPKTSMITLGNVIKLDVSLSSKILQIVNSAFYGLPKKVSSLGKAVALLGFNTIKSVIISVAIIKVFKMHPKNMFISEDPRWDVFRHEHLWVHKLGVGSVARVIAKKVNPSLSEEAFVGGIIHDIGKLITEQFLNDLFQKIVIEIIKKNYSYNEAEASIININHCQIGEFICKKWNFPDSLTEVVAYHHSPMKASESNRNLVHIVHVADIFAKGLQFGNSWDKKISPIDENVFYGLGLKDEDIPIILEESFKDFNNADAYLQFINEI